MTEFVHHSLQDLFLEIRADFTAKRPSCIIVDFYLISSHGFHFLATLVKQYADVPILVLSRMTQPSFVVQGIKSGACDFIPFPCLPDFLRRKVLTYVSYSPTVELTNTDKVPPNDAHSPFGALLGTSPCMCSLKNQLASTALHDEPLLFLGETGTGKSLAAKLVHEASKRQGKPFFELNIAAMSESLTDCELFGAVRGAYTGAVSRQGFFERAHTGTLFLDEIGDIAISIQLKLLHVAENRSFYRLGSTDAQKSDVRLICATNSDLRLSIKNKAFRDDLYYRLAVFPFEIPPLRNRKEDIGLLVDFFLKPAGKKLMLNALDKLQNHHWPGNVRELHNCVRRAQLSCTSNRIDADAIVFFS